MNSKKKEDKASIKEDVKINCRISWCLWDGGGITIYDLYVHKSLRGKGIARLLLESTISEIRSKYPKEKIWIEPKPFGDIGLKKRSLINFYKKFKNLNLIT